MTPTVDPFEWVALMRARQQRAKVWTMVALGWSSVLALLVSR